MQEFESIPTDTIWLMEVAVDLEKSDGRTKIQDTRRHKKNKNRSHEEWFVIFVGLKIHHLLLNTGPQTGVLWYISFECLGDIW